MKIQIEPTDVLMAEMPVPDTYFHKKEIPVNPNLWLQAYTDFTTTCYVLLRDKVTEEIRLMHTGISPTEAAEYYAAAGRGLGYTNEQQMSIIMPEIEKFFKDLE